MIIQLNKSLTLFAFIFSIAILLPLIPESVDARGGHRGGGGRTHSSVNRNHNSNRNVNRNSNRNVNRNTNVNRNVNRNTNVNVNRGRNVNVDVDVNHRRGYGVGSAIAVGAAVAVTAAVVGSIIHTLPSGCQTVVRNGIAYNQCGSVWYEPQYSGNNVTYIVVNQP